MFSGIPILHVGLVSFLVVIVNKVCYQKQSIIKHDHFGNTVKNLRRNEIDSRKKVKMWRFLFVYVLKENFV